MADPNSAVTAADTPRNETILHQLGRSEKYWTWKAGIRSVFGVLTIVALGCAAWTVANPVLLYGRSYIFYSEGTPESVGAIVVLATSFIWSLAWIVLPLLLKPPRSLHPGIAVGFDLILWLAFVAVALFGLIVAVTISFYGSSGVMSDPNYTGSSYSGEYYLAPNDTWVYNITWTRVDPSTYRYNDTTGQFDYDNVDPSTIQRDCTHSFDSCEQEDALINRLWRDKPKRFAIALVINIVEWLGVAAHFTLFVWACVDTHRYNKANVGAKEKIVADRIIADLESRGLISVQDGVITHAASSARTQIPQSTALPPEAAREYGYINEKDTTQENDGIAPAPRPE